jgi:hypothetical protein
LELARASLADVYGLIVLREFEWFPEWQRWALKTRILTPGTQGTVIPRLTEWYVVAEQSYPSGNVLVYPAKRGGILSTFQHQRYNAEGPTRCPWRSGDLCLGEATGKLGRAAISAEPYSAEERLKWHCVRALDWLRLARDGLLGKVCTS